MGTRNLTVVQLDGEYKIAQYGQWDGYPTGQGAKVLEFLKKLKTKKNRKQFEEKLRALQLADDAYLREVQKRHDAGELDGGWTKCYPELSRDTAAGILQMVFDGPPGMRLKHEVDFAKDSLFCEWAYVIDLDNDVLEVYRGFVRTPSKRKNHRFGNESDENGYYPVRLKKKFPFADLPTVAHMAVECGA